MEIFKIEIQEFLARIIEVKAANVDEAINRIHEQYRNEEIVLCSDDYITTEIKEYIE